MMDRPYLKILVPFIFLMLITTPAVPTMAQEGGGFTPIPVIKGMKLLETGTKAPMFAVSDASGSPFDFAQEYSRQAHLMVFWSIFCEPCREEMTVIERVANQFSSKGLAVLAVNLDGEPFLESVRGFMKQGKYSFKVLMDELEDEMFKIADPYNVAGTPVLYLINNKGEVAFNFLGRITAEDLIGEIETMLAAQ